MVKSRTLFILIGVSIVCLIGLILLVFHLLTVNNLPQTSSKTITLTMVGYKYTEAQIQPIINAYEKIHPNILITYNTISEDTYKTYLLGRFHTQNTTLTPDIFEAESADSLTFLKYSSVAPASILSGSEFKQTYYPIYQNKLLYQGSAVVGIPEDLQPLILFYNKRLLALNNQTIGGITTDFNTFNSTLATIAKNAHTNKALNAQYASISIGEPTFTTYASDILQLFMIENQTVMNSPTTYAATFNTQSGIQALQYYQSFTSGDFKDYWDPASEGDLSAFAKEHVMMIYAYPDDIATILSLNPSLQIGYALSPTLVKPVALAHYNYLSVYGASPHTTEAWSFLDYLTNQQNIVNLATSSLPSNHYGVISPRKDTPTNTTISELTTILNQASSISTDWMIDDKTVTQKIFATLITKALGGIGAQGILDKAAYDITAQIQTANHL